MKPSQNAFAIAARRSRRHVASAPRAPARWQAAAALLLILAFTAAPARATLGQGIDSVETDRVHAGASVRQVGHAAFTVHELTTATNGLVREYVAPNGQVFAVTWHGLAKPNLQQLLGAHYDTLASAPPRPPGSRAHVNLAIGGLVFESSGHMRSFHGRAYLNDALPSGVTSNDIK